MFKIASRVCIVLLALTLSLCVASIWIDPWDHFLSLGDGCHISVWSHGVDARLVIFNDAEYGPYRGSIIGIIDDEGNSRPKMLRDVEFGDTAGIYYRYFRWPDATLWTLTASLWYFVGLFAIIPVVRWILAMRRPAD